MLKYIKKLSAPRFIALGFATLILLGSLLLMLPFSTREGVELSYIDALYTATSAVCVTGLLTVEAGQTFTFFGQLILAILIQCGGLGVCAIGAGIMVLVGLRVDFKGRSLVREAMNLESGSGVVKFLKSLFITTFTIEGIGAVLNLMVFSQDYSLPRALWLSIFHAISAFNNAGFDVFGNGNSLYVYRDNVAVNLITAALIFLGGIGFLVIKEFIGKKFNWKRYSFHAKVVISTSAFLIVAGTILLKATENMTWLGAFFNSISSRTAGFSTFQISGFNRPGLMIMIFLMFIGASPGSTGGGIKTTTFFTVVHGLKESATNSTMKAFHYSFAKEAYRKASTIFLMAIGCVCIGTYLFLVFEPQLTLMESLFEVVSALGTVGDSMGITSSISVPSKILSIVLMYTGRLGTLTVANLWHFGKGDRISYPSGNLSIG